MSRLRDAAEAALTWMDDHGAGAAARTGTPIDMALVRDELAAALEGEPDRAAPVVVIEDGGTVAEEAGGFRIVEVLVDAGEADSDPATFAAAVKQAVASVRRRLEDTKPVAMPPEDRS